MSLPNSKVSQSVSQSVSEWVTRSPIELSWTAKKCVKHLEQHNLVNILFVPPVAYQKVYLLSPLYVTRECVNIVWYRNTHSWKEWPEILSIFLPLLIRPNSDSCFALLHTQLLTQSMLLSRLDWCEKNTIDFLKKKEKTLPKAQRNFIVCFKPINAIQNHITSLH